MQFHRKIVLPDRHGQTSLTDQPDQDLIPDQPQQSLAAETFIQTPTGLHRLAALKVGQQVLTRSGRFQKISGIDHTMFTNRQLHTMPEAAPIRFDTGALRGASDTPDTVQGAALLVSPDCPIAWSATPSGTGRFPAQAFCDGGLIRRVIPEDGIHYIRLHFETVQQICADGIWVELDDASRAAHDSPHHMPKLVHDTCVFRPLRN